MKVQGKAGKLNRVSGCKLQYVATKSHNKVRLVDVKHAFV